MENTEVIWPLRKSWVFGMLQGIGYLDMSKMPICCDQRTKFTFNLGGDLQNSLQGCGAIVHLDSFFLR